MSGPPRVPLGDLAEVVMGQAPPGKDCNKDGIGTVFVKAGEFGDRCPSAREWTTKPLKFATKGDVLVCVVGATAGKVNEGIDCAIGRSVAAVRPRKSDHLVPSYLYHFLRTQVVNLRIGAQGVAQGVITREMLQDMRIPVPHLAEQRRIAAILDKADALRAKRRTAIAQLDVLTKSIFLDMFGDPSTNPRKWPVATIGQMLASASYGTSEKSEAFGTFPVLRMNNITTTGGIDLSNLKYMELDDHERERYLVRDGDILFNRTNSAELVGKTALFLEGRPMAYAGYLIRLRVNSDNDPEYLAAFLNTAYAKRVLRGMCKSIIGMANINATELQRIKIPWPPLALQQKLARAMVGVRELREANRWSAAELNSLFASLQYRAFRGELTPGSSSKAA